MLNEENWFGYPFWYQNLLFSENDQLLNYCINFKQNNSSVQKSNVGGWQSEEIFDFSEPILSKFQEFILFLCSPLNDKFNCNFKIANCWININGNNDRNEFHVHPGCDLSGVYYVKSNQEQGDIVFKSPSFDFEIFSLYFIKDNFFKHYPRFVHFKPQTSKTLFFLPHIPHKVDPNLTTCDRVSIAFNLTC